MLPEDKALLERMLAHPPLWHHRLTQADLLRVAAGEPEPTTNTADPPGARETRSAGTAAPVAAAPLPTFSLCASAMMTPPSGFPSVWRVDYGMGGLPR
jgi:hypothetical protein